MTFVIGLCASIRLSASAEGSMNVGEIYNSPQLQYKITAQSSIKDGYINVPGEAIITGFNPQFYKQSSALRLGKGTGGNTINVQVNSTINVPSTQETFKVVGFAPGAFKGCRSLKTFTANSSITEIGSAAFLNCKKLTTFVINSRDTSHEQSTVGKKAFKGVKKLTLTYNEDNGYNAKSLARKIKKAGAKKAKFKFRKG